MPGSGDVSARWLVVVDRSRHDLFDLLRESLKPDAPFQVILDQRRGERRRSNATAPGPERRRAERRQQRPTGGLFVGAFVPAEPAPSPAPPATLPPPPPATSPVEMVTAACPTCWDVLSFELPRFPRPPARLDAEVVHERGPSSTQHYAEIQAFTISGRPLLVQRVEAARHKPLA